MSQVLTYTDKVPKRPGWYWRREDGKVSMVEITLYSNPLGPWKKRRARLLKTLKELNTPKEAFDHVAALPPSHWLVEWAGPLVPPR